VTVAIRTNYELGDPCWADLISPDLDAAINFYPAVLGWTAGESNSDFGGYMMFSKDGQPVAGAMAAPPEHEMMSSWTTYLNVPDAEKFVALAEKNGASVYLAPQVVGDIGTMAVLGDPTGATIGLWAPANFSGFGLYDQAGAPSWFEHHSSDYNGALKFYQSVFNWKTQTVGDTDDFRYSTANHGEVSFAGLMDTSNFLPEPAPSHWSMYVGVENVDASCESVARLGGTVLDGAFDTPYGRIAHVADMCGARFRLRQA
jgi:predicted enzyme related to lactoylglutathione lyase